MLAKGPYGKSAGAQDRGSKEPTTLRMFLRSDTVSLEQGCFGMITLYRQIVVWGRMPP